MASLIVGAIAGAALYNIISNALKPSTSQTINNINKIIQDSIMSSIQQSQDTSSFSQQLNATCDADVIADAQDSYNQCIARFIQSVPSGITLKITTTNPEKSDADGEYELWDYDGEHTIKLTENTHFSTNNIWINKAKTFYIFWDEKSNFWVLSSGDGTKYNKKCTPPEITNNKWSDSAKKYCSENDNKNLCEINKIIPKCDEGWKWGDNEKKNSDDDQHDNDNDGWITLGDGNYCPTTSCYNKDTDKCKLPNDSVAICDSDYRPGNNDLSPSGGPPDMNFLDGRVVVKTKTKQQYFCPKTSCHEKGECKPNDSKCQDEKKTDISVDGKPKTCEQLGSLNKCTDDELGEKVRKVCPLTCGVCSELLCAKGSGGEASCKRIGKKLCKDNKNKECPKDASYCKWLAGTMCVQSKVRRCQYGMSTTSEYSKLFNDTINNRPRPGLNSGLNVIYEPSNISAVPKFSIDEINDVCSVFGDICYVKNVSLKLAVNADTIKRQQNDIISKTTTKLKNDLKQYDKNSGTKQIIETINTQTNTSVVNIINTINKNRVFKQELKLTNVNADIISIKSTGNIIEKELLTNRNLQNSIASISNMITQTSLNTDTLYKNTLLIITFLLVASTIVSLIMILHRSKDLADFLHTIMPYLVFMGFAIVILVVHILAKPRYVTYVDGRDKDDKDLPRKIDKDKLIKYLTAYYSVIGLIIFAVFKFYIT